MCSVPVPACGRADVMGMARFDTCMSPAHPEAGLPAGAVSSELTCTRDALLRRRTSVKLEELNLVHVSHDPRGSLALNTV